MDILRKFTAILATFSLAACGFMADADEVETEVELFRAAYDSQDWETIWSITSEDFRAASAKDEWNALLKNVHAKLGKSVSSERTGWNVNSGTGGTLAVLTYQTQFENGEGMETFTFKEFDNGWKMQGYNIQSNTLIVQPEVPSGGAGEDSAGTAAEGPATYAIVEPIPAPAD